MEKVPVHLKHKPILVLNGYEAIDGKYAGNSDAQGLSLGWAQWNDRGMVDLSAKVWRYTGEKWSRQSEELPLHRVLDLSILIAIAEMTGQGKVTTSVKIQGEDADIEISPEIGPNDLALMKKYLDGNNEYLSERFAILAQLLRQLGY